MNNAFAESVGSKKTSVSPLLIAIGIVAVLRGFTTIYWAVQYVFVDFPTYEIEADGFIYFSFFTFFAAGILSLGAAFFALRRAAAFAGFALLASVLIGDALFRIIQLVQSQIDGWTYNFELPGVWALGWENPDFLAVVAAVSDFSFYPALILGILAVVTQQRSGDNLGKVPAPSPSAAFNSSESSVAGSTPIATQTKGTKMAEIKQWEVMIPGAADAKVDTASLAMWAQAGTVKADTMVKEIATGAVFPARQIPGVFSDKSYITALLISLFLGALGIDRFYTGHTGLGIGKLLTLGGCGIWSLIDFILFAMRKVNDSNGRPLQ
jgi:hypothetical protein